MKAAEGMSLEEIRVFLKASDVMEFQGRNREEKYGWVNQTLRQIKYQDLKRSGRGIVRRYVGKMTGLSRAQVTRLIKVYTGGEEVKAKPYRRHRFARRYSREDIEMLAAVDEAHETMSGPATRKILYRACYEFQEKGYERLGELSVAQLYRLRQSSTYRNRRVAYQPTRPVQVAIGERRRPEPDNRPGYLRVDTVHQGDREGVKGVYQINAVDAVTQWEVVGATPRISEAYLLPVLEEMLKQFPFQIRGFHSDNGSEFINHNVAEMLNKLLIEQTKSRPRHSNDNGLVETKNGWVVRKHMGYGHIAAEHAEEIQTFYTDHLNPYLNFHRPCAVPEIVADEKKKGKEKRVYRWYATPFEILRQLPDLARHIKEGVLWEELEREARAKSDMVAAKQMQEAKRKLFGRIREKQYA
jgi:transposase InsO family protein